MIRLWKSKRERELEKQIEEMQTVIDHLIDEKESTWQLLEEMRASEIQNFQDALEKAHRELMYERLLEGPVVGEA